MFLYCYAHGVKLLRTKHAELYKSTLRACERTTIQPKYCTKHFVVNCVLQIRNLSRCRVSVLRVTASSLERLGSSHLAHIAATLTPPNNNHLTRLYRLPFLLLSDLLSDVLSVRIENTGCSHPMYCLLYTSRCV